MSAQYKKSFEVRINKCDRTKAMYNMEYSTFILNLLFSFVCGLLTFLHLLDVKKDFIPYSGIIGLCCGIVGFILTFIYVLIKIRYFKFMKILVNFPDTHIFYCFLK